MNQVLHGKKAAAMLLLSFLLASGCAGSSDQPSAVVSGKVSLAGAPLSAGTVLFMTDDGNAASAEIGEGGAYSAKCPPGNYKVAVSPPAAPDPLVASVASQPVAKSPPIPKRYHDLGSSGLSVDVKAGENQFDIPLSR
jgi:hypothetical protein